MLKIVHTAWLACFFMFLAAGTSHAGFVDNGNGTVTDTATGLMWQKATATGTHNWAQALAYAESLDLAGHHDWRLPTIKELRSLADYSRYNPAINTDYFPDAFSSFYWSGTTRADITWAARGVDFYYGSDNGGRKNFSHYVRAVRGGQSGAFGDLVIAQSPMSGTPGTTFTQWGTGLTPNSTAVLHFKKPDGVEYPTLSQPIDANGHFEIRYTAPFDKPVGAYTWWGVDGVTGEASSAITYYIDGVSGETDHFRFQSIGDQTAGSGFTVQVEAVDAYGGRVASFSGTVSLFHNGPGVLSPDRIRLTNGVGNAIVSISQPNAVCFLSCRYAGITGQSDTFAVTSGQCANGIITGTVQNLFGEVKVRLGRFAFGITSLEVTATSNGQYLFPGVPAGKYYIWAINQDQKTSASQSVKVECGQTTRAPNLETHLNKRPVIFVPGIMGTDKKWAAPDIYPTLPVKFPADREDLQIHNPGSVVKGYAGAVGWEKLGDRLDDRYEIYECPYDWRVSLKSGTDTYKKYLLPVIDKAREDTGWSKVDIVAHSMGGLLVRSYIQSRDYRGDIEKFAMVGTPNHGSLNAYHMWEGGDPPLADEKAGGASLHFYTFTTAKLYSAKYKKSMLQRRLDGKALPALQISRNDARSFIWENCSSILQLMPVFDDCLIDNGTPKGIGILKNDWLINLNQDSNLNRIQNGGPVKTQIFASKDENTLSQMHVIGSTIDGLYEDGMEEKSPVRTEGDKTVLYESATLPNVTIMTGSYGEHGRLVKSFAYDIEAFLNYGREITSMTVKREALSLTEEPTASLGITITGPPSILLTDSSGVRCGIDQESQQVFEEITGSQALGESGQGMVNIPDPAEGVYHLKLSGATAGNADLSFSLMTETDFDEENRSLYFSGSPIELTLEVSYADTPPIRVFGIPAAPDGFSAEPYESGGNTLTRLEWQSAPGETTAAYRVYVCSENEPVFHLLESVPGDRTFFETNDPWNAPGRIYMVSAADSQGREGFLSVSAENREHLLADFEAAPVSGNAQVTVEFTDKSTGTPTAWNWNFGDGTTGTEPNPTHTYTVPGAYSVSLVVTFPDGSQDLMTVPDLISVSALVDLNGDHRMDLADAILGLRVLAGLGSVPVTPAADVNGDGKIGLEEVIYILEKVAGLR